MKLKYIYNKVVLVQIRVEFRRIKHLENSKKKSDDMERKKMQIKEKEEILEAIRMKVSLLKSDKSRA